MEPPTITGGYGAKGKLGGYFFSTRGEAGLVVVEMYKYVIKMRHFLGIFGHFLYFFKVYKGLSGKVFSAKTTQKRYNSHAA